MQKTTINVLVVVTFIGVVSISACRDRTSLEPAAETVLVDIHDAGFAPETVHVEVGRSVRWTNRSQTPHAISSADFSSGSLFHEWWFEAQFSAPGAIDYFCPLHETKEGTIVVEATAP